MRPHPWIVALAIVLAGVMAFGTTVIVRQREARRLRRLPLPPDAPEPVMEVRRWVPPPASAAPPPEPEPERAAPVPPTGVARIRVTGPHGLQLAGVEASAVRQGDPEATEVELDEPTPEDEARATRRFTSLPLGRYDVTVKAPGMRPLRVEGMPTNGEPVAVVLERAPLLRGAIGWRSEDWGQGCSVMRGRVTDAHGKRLALLGNVDRDECSFAVEDLPSTGPLVISLSQRGRQSEQALVTVPMTGDPLFLCVAPPCAGPSASLAVYVADTNGVQVESASIEWTLVGAAEDRGELGSLTTSPGVTYLHWRRPGETLQLFARVDERSVETTVVVGAGVTDVVLTVPAGEGPGERAPQDVE